MLINSYNFICFYYTIDNYSFQPHFPTLQTICLWSWQEQNVDGTKPIIRNKTRQTEIDFLFIFKQSPICLEFIVHFLSFPKELHSDHFNFP